ncbi:MAG: hypothetical protein GY952_14155 [Rhodobacteraceae bacterium]|nr:hypothetical protein [Paracoccaceae bacterium]
MSYGNNKYQLSINLGELDFADAAGDVKIPVGSKRWNILAAQVMVTETFNQVTTPGYLRLGTDADADAYFEKSMAATAIGEGVSSFNESGNTEFKGTDRASAYNGSGDIKVSWVAPTGGTPAGKGHVNILVELF